MRIFPGAFRAIVCACFRSAIGVGNTDGFKPSVFLFAAFTDRRVKQKLSSKKVVCVDSANG